MTSEPNRQLSQGDPPWSAPSDLGECVAALVNVVARGMEEISAPHGLAHMEFALLRLFMKREEWTTTDLAEVLPVNVSRISRMVSKLVSMGLMQRRRLRSDRRVVMLTLTERGRGLTQEFQQRVSAYYARLCQGISDSEMFIFESCTSRIVANFAAMAPPAPLPGGRKPD